MLPAVVLVMVTHDPGDWFEETLASVAAQDYQNISVLVVDTASEHSPRDRIAEVLPSAHLIRLKEDPGFGAACNEVLSAVEGAAFFVFCHDDVALDPDAIGHLVEEAFRSNAGVVGPKLVEWHDPSRLLSVGMGADRFGFPVDSVERGELDQAQHDSVREVWYIPGAVTLIRADVFAAVGGFDPGITFHGDDLDISWRVRLAGGHVVVAPQARVRHLEALGERRDVDDRRQLQMRHRLRVTKVCYSRASRMGVMPRAFILMLIEVVWCTLIGRFRQVRDVAGAWSWNWSHSSETHERRRLLREVRTVSDRDVRYLQSRGSRRLSAFLRGQIGASDDKLLMRRRARSDIGETLRSSKARTALVVWIGLLALLAVGSRDLILHSIPAIGDFPVFGDSATSLLREWASGYRSSGLGSVSPNPTGLGFAGVGGMVLFGNLELARKLLIIGMLPIGAAGMWRLVGPVGTRRSRIVGLVVYMSIPLAYNAIAHGRWSGLVMFGLVPWILSQLTRASGLAPFGPRGGEAGPGVRVRPLFQRVVAIGVLTALVAMISPVAIVLVPAMAVVMALGGLLAGQLAGSVRMITAAVGGAAVAFVLQLPWSATFISADWQAIAGTSSAGGSPLHLDQILRFETGPWGAAPLGYAFFVVGVISLAIGREWRLSWAVRGWALALAGFAGVWVSARGWLPGELPSPEMLLAPGAAGLALAAMLGMAAFEVDLPDYHFGWRQVASLAGAVALILGVVPLLGAAVGGRWDLPGGDYNRPLGFLDSQAADDSLRVLWIGEAASVPVAGWRLDLPEVGDLGAGSTLVYATTRSGTPELSDRWAGSSAGSTERLARLLELAASGDTSRLGGLLAPMGVRYIVIPLGPAPAPYVDDPVRPEALLDVLARQLDLTPLDVNVGMVVYRNEAWGPTRALLDRDAKVPDSAGSDVAAQPIPELEGAPVALGSRDRYADYSGTVDSPSKIYLSEASSDRWRLDVGGSQVSRSDAVGWANVFEVDRTGAARLRFDTPASRTLALVGQSALWLAAIVYMLVVRVVTDERRSLRRASMQEASEHDA